MISHFKHEYSRSHSTAAVGIFVYHVWRCHGKLVLLCMCEDKVREKWKASLNINLKSIANEYKYLYIFSDFHTSKTWVALAKIDCVRKDSRAEKRVMHVLRVRCPCYRCGDYCSSGWNGSGLSPAAETKLKHNRSSGHWGHIRKRKLDIYTT